METMETESRRRPKTQRGAGPMMTIRIGRLISEVNHLVKCMGFTVNPY
jgi:hypothetical protein